MGSRNASGSREGSEIESVSGIGIESHLSKQGIPAAQRQDPPEGELDPQCLRLQERRVENEWQGDSWRTGAAQVRDERDRRDDHVEQTAWTEPVSGDHVAFFQGAVHLQGGVCNLIETA